MLTLQQATVRTILGWAMRHPDIEVCGLVWAAQGVEHVTPLRNTAKEPAKYYEVDPAELMVAYRHMDEAQGMPVAFYHSHPGGTPDPSEADMAGAMNAGMFYLIAYPDRSGGWAMTAWECLSYNVLVGTDLLVGS